MMKVLIISNMYPNEFYPTSGIFVREQCKSLISLGIEVQIISPTPLVFPGMKYLSKKWKNYSKIPEVEDDEGIRIIRPKFIAIPSGFLKQYWYLYLYHFYKSKLFLYHKQEKFDLIHVQGSAPDDYTGYLLSKKLQIPYILTIHGETVFQLPKKKNRFRSSKIAIEKADSVIGVSNKIINQIVLLTNKKTGLFKIYNGYVPSNYKLTSNKKNTFNILFAGTLIERKGVSYLIEAFRMMFSGFERLHIVGDGDQIEKLKNLARESTYDQFITFHGYLDHSKLLVKMSECDVFVMPSWDEAFGVVYLEAMSLGKAVIGTKGEGIEDIIEDGQNGLLANPRDVESIAEKIILIRDNEFLRKEIEIHSFETSQKYTWAENARQTIDLYEQVLNKKQND